MPNAANPRKSTILQLRSIRLLSPIQHATPDPSLLTAALPGATDRARSLARWLLMLVALMPMAWLARETVGSARNIAQWDDYDHVLGLVMAAQNRPADVYLLDFLLWENSGHRTVTSRAIVLASQYVFGRVNFDFFLALGWAWILAACAILIMASRSQAGRLRMLVVLGFTLFTLQHYESFLWSGSSIDHFAVVMLACGALTALAHLRGWKFGFAVALALAASVTLAHGLAIWPVGLLMLVRDRRWRETVAWVLAGLLTVVAYFHGMSPVVASSVNPNLVGWILTSWLTLLGTPAALGADALAPWLGAVLAGLIAWRVYQDLKYPKAGDREPHLAVVLWAVLSLGLIAMARTTPEGFALQSRYLILSSVAWALTIAWLLERASSRAGPIATTWLALAPLAAFTLLANRTSADLAATFIEQRDRAALSYLSQGRDGAARSALHPHPELATRLLKMSAAQGIYRFPDLCRLNVPERARASDTIDWGIEYIGGNANWLTISGWAAIAGATVKRGDIELLLHRDASTHAVTTVQFRRDDLVAAHKQPGWRLAGFSVVVSRAGLEADRFQLGLWLRNGRDPRSIATDIILDLTGATPTSTRGYVSFPETGAQRKSPGTSPGLSGTIDYFVEDITQGDRFATIRGWAGMPGTRMPEGSLSVLLRGEDGSQIVVPTLQRRRPDVAEARQQPMWSMPGFRVVLDYRRLPPGRFTVGFLVTHDRQSASIFTDHTVEIRTPKSVPRPVASPR